MGDSTADNGGQEPSNDGEEEKIPAPDITLRRWDVQPRTEDVPSLGFFSPHMRRRFEAIENLTDRQTALRVYATVKEGPVSNFEKALKKAVHGRRLSPDYSHIADEDDDRRIRWRYYCEGCGFIGAASKSFTQAEWGGQQHEQFCEEDGTPTIFAYYTEEWDPDDAPALAAAGEPAFK